MATDRSGPLQGARREPASGGEQGVLPPLLRVVTGDPTPEELAALTVVVAALSQRRTRRRPTPAGGWASYGDAHRRPLQPGHGGWRAAGRFA
ncbi:MAG TPA: acyl-CoA carboxylase subunit epsilon [Blastococcus sp.]|nr:acyl-CoA carboxylase subunit epsilon [Blastococcus sp.]